MEVILECTIMRSIYVDILGREQLVEETGQDTTIHQLMVYRENEPNRCLTIREALTPNTEDNAVIVVNTLRDNGIFDTNNPNVTYRIRLCGQLEITYKLEV